MDSRDRNDTLVGAMERIEYCNIWKPKCEPKLVKGEKWCPYCKGLGAKFVDISFKQRYVTLRRCFTCNGEGKIDWITAITHQPIDPRSMLSSSSMKDVNLKCRGHLKCKKRLKRLWQNEKQFDKGPWHPEGSY